HFLELRYAGARCVLIVAADNLNLMSPDRAVFRIKVSGQQIAASAILTHCGKRPGNVGERADGDGVGTPGARQNGYLQKERDRSNQTGATHPLCLSVPPATVKGTAPSVP